MAVADCIGLALANLRLRETLRNQSIRDPLTGLFNVRFVQEWLEREIRRAVRNKRTLSIITFDIDHFKRFNDTFGHAGGDLLLRELAILLVAQIRGGDIACRIGGEEFAILLPEAPLEIAVQRAEKIRKEVHGLAVQYHGQPLGRITISLGVAAFPEHGDSAEQLFRVADQAVYRAKSEGRDRVIVAASGPIPSETSSADS